MEEKFNITDYIVQEYMITEYSTDVLHRKLFDVNMRLFNTSPEYRAIITRIIIYMDKILNSKFYNYTDCKGISGANLGIPFNIIGMKLPVDCSTTTRVLLTDGFSGNAFLINPKVVGRSTETKICMSNCGSIRLKVPVKIRRNIWVVVKYFGVTGKHCEHKFEGNLGFTVQHEIEHNLGVLITDKEEL